MLAVTKIYNAPSKCCGLTQDISSTERWSPEIPGSKRKNIPVGEGRNKTITPTYSILFAAIRSRALKLSNKTSFVRSLKLGAGTSWTMDGPGAHKSGDSCIQIVFTITYHCPTWHPLHSPNTVMTRPDTRRRSRKGRRSGTSSSQFPSSLASTIPSSTSSSKSDSIFDSNGSGSAPSSLATSVHPSQSSRSRSSRSQPRRSQPCRSAASALQSSRSRSCRSSRPVSTLKSSKCTETTRPSTASTGRRSTAGSGVSWDDSRRLKHSAYVLYKHLQRGTDLCSFSALSDFKVDTHRYLSRYVNSAPKKSSGKIPTALSTDMSTAASKLSNRLSKCFESYNGDTYPQADLTAVQECMPDVATLHASTWDESSRQTGKSRGPRYVQGLSDHCSLQFASEKIKPRRRRAGRKSMSVSSAGVSV